MNATELPNAGLALERFRDLKGDLTFKDELFAQDLADCFEDLNLFSVGKFRLYPLSVILDYLRKTHGYYIQYYLPKMEMAISAIKQCKSTEQAGVVLELFYINYKNELLEHIELEERKLFPYAEKLYDGIHSDEYSVKQFKSEHNHEIEDLLSQIFTAIKAEFPDLVNDFAFRAFEHLLERFRYDLDIHHGIEERVFLTKVAALELEV